MAKKESLLWSFQEGSSARVHYILGTMHVKSEEAYTAVTVSQYFMEQCAIYAGEMDLNDPLLGHLDQIFLNGEGKLLSHYLGSKKYKKYHRIIQKAFGIDLDEVAHFKPMVVSNMIAETVLTNTYDMALDHFLWEMAQASGMKMVGLESAATQFEIMEQIPIDIQLEALKSCTSNVTKFRKKTLRLSELYKEGALTQLYKASKKSMGKLRKLMIYDRNAYMLSQLIPLTKEGATFCAVGAAHLPGNKGLLRGLKAHGFKVKPILLN